MITFSQVLAGQEELPFWRQKKELERQITFERKIIVRVNKEEVGQQKKFRMLGVGAVNVPTDFCVKRIQQFEKLKEVSSYFHEVRHWPEQREIVMGIKAMGYQARMKLVYRMRQLPASEMQQLDWQVKEGSFKGMVGHFQFRAMAPVQTEISLWTHFVASEIPIPAFFLRFTLEVIAEKVAQKMRSYLERSYRENGGKDVGK